MTLQTTEPVYNVKTRSDKVSSKLFVFRRIKNLKANYMICIYNVRNGSAIRLSFQRRKLIGV